MCVYVSLQIALDIQYCFDRMELINNTIRKRILNHKDFVNQRIKEKGIESVKYFNDWFEL